MGFEYFDKAILRLPYETGSTSANFRNYGITRFAGTTASPIFTMKNPNRAGILKVLFATGGSTAAVAKVKCASSACSYDGTNDVAAFNAAGDCLLLLSRSSVRWDIIVNTGSVALSTST